MLNQAMKQCADELFNRIIDSGMATQVEFLDYLIGRLQSHRVRMNDLFADGIVDVDSLPAIQAFGQSTVTMRLGKDRFYIVQHPVPAEAKMDDPKVTTLRGTPQDLLDCINRGEGKTDDFELRITTNDGVIPGEYVEIKVIDQKDTAFVQPLKFSKSHLQEFLQYNLNA